MSKIDGGLRSLFQENIRRAHWQSIETGGTGSGIPDSNYCLDGVEGWVEYKQTSGWNVKLAPFQIGWHLQRHRAGGRTFVAVRRWCDEGPRRESADELWLFAGREAKAIRQMGLDLETPGLLGRWMGGPSSWRWDVVQEILTRRS